MPKGIVIFSLIFYLFGILADVWLQFLLMNSLYGEGITALFFAILLKEILDRADSRKNHPKMSNTLQFAAFWMVSGALYLSKPFVSYLCFLLPFFYKKLPCKELTWHWFSGVLTRLAPMLVIPLLWILAGKIGDAASAHYSPSVFTKVDFSAIATIMGYWLKNKITLAHYLLCIAGAFIGITASNRFKISSSLFFVILNLLMVWGLYSTMWIDVEKQSAFRYFSETHYLCLYAFIYGMSKIIEDVDCCAIVAGDKIRLLLVRIGLTSCAAKTAVPTGQQSSCNRIAVIGIVAFILACVLFLYSRSDIRYLGFHYPEKWSDGAHYRWATDEARIKLKKGGLIELTFVCSHPDAETNPIVLSVFSAKTLLDRITFNKPAVATRRYSISNASKKSKTLKLTLSRTWNPRAMGISPDYRDLGVAVRDVKYLEQASDGDEGFYGWEEITGYQLPGWPAEVPQKFRWMSKHGTMGIRLAKGEKIRLWLMCAHPKIAQDPVAVHILLNGKRVWGEEFSDHQWKKISIDVSDPATCNSLNFQASRTWNPKKTGYSEDDRDLGVAVAIPKSIPCNNR